MTAAGRTAEGHECFAVYRRKGSGKNQIVRMERGVKSEAINTVKIPQRITPSRTLCSGPVKMASPLVHMLLQRGQIAVPILQLMPLPGVFPQFAHHRRAELPEGDSDPSGHHVGDHHQTGQAIQDQMVVGMVKSLKQVGDLIQDLGLQPIDDFQVFCNLHTSLRMAHGRVLLRCVRGWGFYPARMAPRRNPPGAVRMLIPLPGLFQRDRERAVTRYVQQTPGFFLLLPGLRGFKQEKKGPKATEFNRWYRAKEPSVWPA